MSALDDLKNKPTDELTNLDICRVEDDSERLITINAAAELAALKQQITDLTNEAGHCQEQYAKRGIEIADLKAELAHAKAEMNEWSQAAAVYACNNSALIARIAEWEDYGIEQQRACQEHERQIEALRHV